MNTLNALARSICEAGDRQAQTVSVEFAIAQAIGSARVINETMTLPLRSAIGRVTAADHSSHLDLPPFDASAMDGYAVHSAVCAIEGMCRQRIVGEVRAGNMSNIRVASGEAVRIFTGAELPAGCDTVLMQEHCVVEDGWIEHLGPVRPSQNVRKRAEDVKRGATLVQPGDILTAGRLALMSAGGHSIVNVFRKVRVGFISTGSELREPGEELSPGQIYNSNRIFLSGMLSALSWIELADFGNVPDDPASLDSALTAAADTCDALITTGGVSTGSADHVTQVLKDAGAQLAVMKVAMRPGKPVKIGTLGNKLVIGLPGNPVAALVGLRQFAFPALRKMAGLRLTRPIWKTGIADFAYEKRPDRTEFLPVIMAGEDDLGRPLLQFIGRGSSASMTAVGNAEAICVLPSDMVRLIPGDRVPFEILA